MRIHHCILWPCDPVTGSQGARQSWPYRVLCLYSLNKTLKCGPSLSVVGDNFPLAYLLKVCFQKISWQASYSSFGKLWVSLKTSLGQKISTQHCRLSHTLLQSHHNSTPTPVITTPTPVITTPTPVITTTYFCCTSCGPPVQHNPPQSNAAPFRGPLKMLLDSPVMSSMNNIGHNMAQLSTLTRWPKHTVFSSLQDVCFHWFLILSGLLFLPHLSLTLISTTLSYLNVNSFQARLEGAILAAWLQSPKKTWKIAKLQPGIQTKRQHANYKLVIT